MSGWALALMWLLLPSLAAGQASLVQVNSSGSSFVYRDSVAVPFTAVQTGGDLNVVVVGWNDTSATIASVADSNGNTYVLAGSTISTAVPAPGDDSQVVVSQAIYYAKNIHAGANTVTTTFNQSTAVQSVRIVEYSGLDVVNPLDTAVESFGTAVPADSGAATTNSPNDLLFGAGTITTAFTSSGAGFATVLLNGLGDIVEDNFVTAAGSYNATAAFATGGWVMQMAAFREAGQTPPTFSAPAITSLSVSSSPEAGGIALTLTGTNFEPGASVLFSNASGTTASGVNCTVTLQTAPNATLACLTPSFPAGLGSLTVSNVDGQASAPSAFTFTSSTPFATAVSPGIGPDGGSTNGGDLVEISGSAFAAGATLSVGGVPADRVSVENVNTILASVPAGPAGLATVVVRNPSGTTGTLPGGYTYAPGTGISFVQLNSAQPTSPAATADVTYALAQTAGNLNLVIIGWADATAQVQSVTDSAGNTYTLAFAPTVGTGLSQAIYYAKDIAAAASNTVTITFDVAAQSPDVRVLEYSGVDTITPLDSGGGSAGTGTALDSGPITTSKAGDLIVGAALAGDAVSAAGLAFTTVNITSLGDAVEHLVGAAAGDIDATATQASDTNWVMQAMAFQPSGVTPDFSLSVTPPASASVTAGQAATYTISVSALDGFNSAVTLTCSAGLPLGSSCSFEPPSVTPGVTPVTSTLTITTTAATPAGTSDVTVTGTFGALSHDGSVALTVAAAPPADFTIAGSALSPASVPAGASSTSTITVAPLNGFAGTVSLTCSITPVVTPAPTCSFMPASIANGTGTSTLTVSTSATTPTGAYSVTVTGAFGSLLHTAPVTLTVTAAEPDFTVAASALNPATISPGGSSTATITVAPANGFNGAVGLTCSVTPSGMRPPTCSLNPASVAGGSGTSTLTVSTTAATTASLTPRVRGALFAMWLPIAGLALLGSGFRSRKKRLWCFLFGCLMFSGLIFLGACGGSSSSGGGGGHAGTPAGTYTITVTATGTGTSGPLTHAATAKLTVQ
ncbi:MAG: beta strand repeat-containing protein [Terriglobales bacterium]